MISTPATIQSRHNPRYKRWLDYVDHPEGDGCDWIAVEGWKQVQDLASRRAIEVLLYTEEPDTRKLEALLSRSRETFRLSPALLERLSSVRTPQGVVAFFEKPRWGWNDLTRCILYLHRLQDPGNLGTLLRAAWATGIFSLVTSPQTVSCFNPKVVRASATALFSVPFLQGVSLEEVEGRGYRLWAASPRGEASLFEARFSEPLAIILGSEGLGLNGLELPGSCRRLRVPMRPETESLNAAVAGSIILYEVFRQRTLHGQHVVPAAR